MEMVTLEHTDGVMRTDLEGATLTYTPKAEEGTPETTTEKIPYETKREFDPKLEPGTEKVVQKGENGEKQQQHLFMSIQLLVKK